MKPNKKRVLLIGVIILLLVLAVYFTFFFTRKCLDRACFDDNLKSCSKSEYINNAEDATWLYKIKGESGESCEVYVKLLKLKEGNVDLASLEGKDMICLPILGDKREPEDNLARCHGLLKEEMQNILLTGIHSYIVPNLGEIGEELNKEV